TSASWVSASNESLFVRSRSDKGIFGLLDPVDLGVAASMRIDDARLTKAVDERERLRHLGEDRGSVCRVDPEGLESRQRMRVDRLHDEQAGGLECTSAELEQALQVVVRKMLDHLDGDHSAETSLEKVVEVGDGVRLLDAQPFRPGALDHARVD